MPVVGMIGPRAALNAESCRGHHAVDLVDDVAGFRQSLFSALKVPDRTRIRGLNNPPLSTYGKEGSSLQQVE
jgi:hypothetical protein